MYWLKFYSTSSSYYFIQCIFLNVEKGPCPCLMFSFDSIQFFSPTPYRLFVNNLEFSNWPPNIRFGYSQISLLPCWFLRNNQTLPRVGLLLLFARSFYNEWPNSTRDIPLYLCIQTSFILLLN